MGFCRGVHGGNYEKTRRITPEGAGSVGIIITSLGSMLNKTRV
jgi:hypothetical protein